MVEDIGIEPGTAADLEGIAAIYHHYVGATAHSFETDLKPLEWWEEWFATFSARGRHRLVVARAEGGILGYASSDQYRPRPAYAPSVTTSVYVAPTHVGLGIGSLVYGRLFAALEDEDVHRAYAAIAMPNPASVRLHERFGFHQVGYFTEQGRKFERYWDVAWFERASGAWLGPGRSAPSIDSGPPCRPPSCSGPSGATRARARRSITSPTGWTSWSATRAGTTRATRSSPRGGC